MKINYVPGLALRFYPGLSRELYDAVDTYVASGCKIAIFTGTAPTEPGMWNLTNFSNYVAANTAKLVYQETTQLQFSYDGFKHKRVIQRYPIDSTIISPAIAPIAQDQAAIDLGAIKTDNSLYALIYCPDKDTTLNTTGNDLVLLIPNVGAGATDFCSLSKVNFNAGESIYFRNLTISLFQGYQITDTLITEVQPDPENPGQNINVPIDSKKSVYINKTWGTRLSEAYRDCFISKDVNFKVKPIGGALSTVNSIQAGNYFSDVFFSSTVQYGFVLRKYDTVTPAWTATTLYSEYDKTPYYGYLVNQSMLDLIDTINTKALLGQLSSISTLLNITGTAFGTNQRLLLSNMSTGAPIALGSYSEYQFIDLIPAILSKAVLLAHSSTDIKNSIKQLLIEQGFDEGMVTSALKSIVPIGFDNTKYNSNFDKEQNVLTIQNATPAKLKTRYKKTIQNPTNEQLYIIIPRYMNRASIENTAGLQPWNNLSDIYFLSSIGSVSYPATQKVLDGEVVDSSTQRIRQQDYTAISIGVTGNGNTDLEYDLLDTIDYVDSFTAMIKVPNKF